MRVALSEELGGIDGVELGERPDPAPAAGQVLVRVDGAGVSSWDVGFLSGGFPGLALPFVPGQEVAGVVEAVGGGVGVQPGERVHASLLAVHRAAPRAETDWPVTIGPCDPVPSAAPTGYEPAEGICFTRNGDG